MTELEQSVAAVMTVIKAVSTESERYNACDENLLQRCMFQCDKKNGQKAFEGEQLTQKQTV